MSLYAEQIMGLAFILILVVLVGALVAGWLAGTRARRQAEAKRLHAPRTATTAESERLVGLRYERGEIDRATYERELDEIRRRPAA